MAFDCLFCKLELSFNLQIKQSKAIFNHNKISYLADT